MLEKSIKIIKSAYEQFIGGGMYFAIFLIAMLYIFLKKKIK